MGLLLFLGVLGWLAAAVGASGTLSNLTLLEGESAGVFYVRGLLADFNATEWISSCSASVAVPVEAFRVAATLPTDPLNTNPTTAILEVVTAMHTVGSVDPVFAVRRLVANVQSNPAALVGFYVVSALVYSFEQPSDPLVSRDAQSAILIVLVVLVAACACGCLYCVIYCCSCNYYLSTQAAYYAHWARARVDAFLIGRRKAHFEAQLAALNRPGEADFQSLRVEHSSVSADSREPSEDMDMTGPDAFGDDAEVVRWELG